MIVARRELEVQPILDRIMATILAMSAKRGRGVERIGGQDFLRRAVNEKRRLNLLDSAAS